MRYALLDDKFKQVASVSYYKSLIWTERFDEPGDFELYIPMDESLPQIYQIGYYLWCSDSEYLMVIENRKVESDPEDGDFYLITGRSVESILDRRVVWDRTDFVEKDDVEPNLQNGVKKLLNENLINPAMLPRKIENFIFEETTDEVITKLTLIASYLGQDLLDVISKLCKEEEIGFKVTLNDDDKFVFKLIAGTDRTYDQTENPYVLFSPKRKNIINTNYLESTKTYKNVALIVGETETKTDKDGNEYVVSRIDYEFSVLNDDQTYAFTGLDRREVFVDATSLKLEDGDNGVRTAEEYQALLRKRGIDALIEGAITTAFDGELVPDVMYEYGKDYYIGDLVQFEDLFGHEGIARVTEFIRSHDDNGMTMYPTFTIIEKGVYET